PGLLTYQWDDATPLPGGNATDINQERGGTMAGEADAAFALAQQRINDSTAKGTAIPELAHKVIGDVLLDTALRVVALQQTVASLAAQVSTLAGQAGARS